MGARAKPATTEVKDPMPSSRPRSAVAGSRDHHSASRNGRWNRHGNCVSAVIP